ncbi:MAG: ABC transporter substrate-binding protein [Alphaproteobacteria bacterium]|nr:ABC transporter substrate-binding protein [Alphaproteobacteria bacterium]
MNKLIQSLRPFKMGPKHADCFKFGSHLNMSQKEFCFSYIKNLLLGLMLLSFVTSCQKSADHKVVAVTQIVAHPAVDEVRRGIKEGLAQAGYREGHNLTWVYENAHGNIATANQIAQKFVGMKPDVMVAITTSSAQAAASATRSNKIPVVFAAVTDPLAAGLVRSLAAPEGNITGTTDMPPIEKQILLIREIMPNLKILGVLYNVGEANSAAQVEKVKQVAKTLDIKVITKAAENSTKVLSAAQGLITEVDAIYVPLDNTVASALRAVITLCMSDEISKKLPVFASDPEGVHQGAVATIGFTHYEEGKKAGIMVAHVLKGQAPASMAVQSPQHLGVYLNLKSAQDLGIQIPTAMIKNAIEVIK